MTPDIVAAYAIKPNRQLNLTTTGIDHRTADESYSTLRDSLLELCMELSSLNDPHATPHKDLRLCVTTKPSKTYTNM